MEQAPALRCASRQGASASDRVWVDEAAASNDGHPAPDITVRLGLALA